MTDPPLGHLPPDQGGRTYTFHWWMRIYIWIVILIYIIPLCIIMFRFFVMMFLLGRIVGWIFFLVYLGVAPRGLAGASLFLTSYQLTPHGLYLRLPFVRLLVPWENITGLSYHRWPYHIVHTRKVRPLRFLFLLSSLLRGGESFGLIAGLKDRNELFWEIRRRASLAQGRQIPVARYRGPIPPI